MRVAKVDIVRMPRTERSRDVVGAPDWSLSPEPAWSVGGRELDGSGKMLSTDKSREAT
jgi:hypothetical protein